MATDFSQLTLPQYPDTSIQCVEYCGCYLIQMRRGDNEDNLLMRYVNPDAGLGQTSDWRVPHRFEAKSSWYAIDMERAVAAAKVVDAFLAEQNPVFKMYLEKIRDCRNCRLKGMGYMPGCDRCEETGYPNWESEE